ncbi:unknow (plasmid) [Vibrio campbellii]|nr:unknow [Vibrio campbellii]
MQRTKDQKKIPDIQFPQLKMKAKPISK